MKIITLLFIMLVAVSCASKRDMRDDLNNDFEWIKNDDFRPKKQIRYVPYKDIYDDEIAGWDSLSAESIARIPRSKLEVVNEKDVPISSAVSFCYQNNFKKGFEILDALYHNHKKHSGYWNQVGSCYYLKGNFRKALLYYNKARDLNSKYSPAINNLGVIYQKDGYDQKALVAYSRAARLNAFSVTPTFNLAQLYLKYGLVKKAVKLFNGLFLRNQNDVDVINGLATSYLFMGKYSKAIEYYSRIDDEYLEKPYIGLNYVVALKFSNQTEEARDLFGDIDNNKLGSLRGYYQKVAKFVGVEK